MGVVNSTFSSVVGNFLVDFLETLVILSTILLLTKSPVASAVFCIALLEAVFIASVADFLAVSTSFFQKTILLILLAKDMNLYPFTYTLSLGSIEYLIFIRYLITIIKFILSSISNGYYFDQ